MIKKTTFTVNKRFKKQLRLAATICVSIDLSANAWKWVWHWRLVWVVQIWNNVGLYKRQRWRSEWLNPKGRWPINCPLARNLTVPSRWWPRPCNTGRRCGRVARRSSQREPADTRVLRTERRRPDRYPNPRLKPEKGKEIYYSSVVTCTRNIEQFCVSINKGSNLKL